MSTLNIDTTTKSTEGLVFRYNTSSTKIRLLAGITGLLAVAVIGLIVALVVVANDKDNNKERNVANTDSGQSGEQTGDRPPDCRPVPGSVTPELDKANCILDRYPLVDGHNDLPWRYRYYADNKVYSVDLRSNLAETWTDHANNPSHTDIPRLRKGKLGAQFWANYVSCDGQYKDAVRMSLDQMDVIKKFVARYPDTFTFVTTAQGILDAFNDGKIASMVGLEGGHSIDSSLGNLRMFYDLGVRYMTVTHSCNTPWADNWRVDLAEYNETADGKIHNGLTEFGKKVILEMNRIGMLVDLSHVAYKTMKDVLEIAKAPVIYSHSSAYSICAHYRNVQDDILHMTKTNGGVVMVNFYDEYINCPPYHRPNATLGQVADHIDYIKNLIGVDFVGIGADYDGVPSVPEGLEDVSTYPALFAELVRRGWSDEDLQKLAGRNLVRAFKQAEKVRDELLSYIAPYEDILPEAERQPNNSCRTDF